MKCPPSLLLTKWNLFVKTFSLQQADLSVGEHTQIGITSYFICLTSCLHVRLSSTQPRRSMRRSRKECLISTTRWETLNAQFSVSILFFFFCSRLLFFLLFPRSPRCEFPAACVASRAPSSLGAEREGVKTSSASFDSSQAKLSMFLLSSAPFSTYTLHSLIPSLFCLTLVASCQLINSSHLTRSRSFSKKTNTHSVSL